MITSNNGVSLLKNLKSAATINFHADKVGLDLIEGQEGLRLNAYLDSAGVPTIGWGSTRYADGTRVKIGDKLKDQAAADQLFLTTLKGYESDIERMIKVPITQNQFDALLSLHYNTGCITASVCTLRTKLNTGDYLGAASQFLVWNKSKNPKTNISEPNPVLTRRRQIEYNLFVKDIKTAA
jgi:lysozyme